MAPSPARLLIFLLPTPNLTPPPPARRPRRAWAGTARCAAPEAAASGGFVVIEDDLSELLQVHFFFRFFSPFNLFGNFVYC
jgi:hypothetical protein